MIQGWEPIFPGVRLFNTYEPEPVSDQLVEQRGWGFHTFRHGFDPGEHRFSPRVVGLVLIRGWGILFCGGAVTVRPKREM